MDIIEDNVFQLWGHDPTWVHLKCIVIDLKEQGHKSKKVGNHQLGRHNGNTDDRDSEDGDEVAEGSV